MKIKMRSISGILPSYETAGAAGMDIRAFLREPVTIEPGQRALIPTGLFTEIPAGFEAQIRARSGLAIKTEARLKFLLSTGEMRASPLMTVTELPRW